MPKRIKARIIGIVIGCFVLLIGAGYPVAKKFLRVQPLTYYRYHAPPQPAIETANASGPSRAVPILMYHGVTRRPDANNTTIRRFIETMEMLKREGYTTLSLASLDAFYQGKFQLPARPIIITFDDGRRDSFLTTDDVLRQLGFQATLFEVTGKANDHDPFYLSWEELAQVQKTGRWDIQAHGQYSHDLIPIDDQGTQGRFLTSRRFIPGHGIETIEEYNQRIEHDYQAGIQDLRDRLGIDPKYYAIPLNDYGSEPIFNHAGAYVFNQAMIHKYFRMAFVQALVYEPNQQAAYLDQAKYASIYNYHNQDPLQTARIEPKNMSAELLKKILDQYYPTEPRLSVTIEHPDTFSTAAHLAYGAMAMRPEGLAVTGSTASPSSKVTFGDAHWENYTVTATMQRASGRSIVLMANAQDNQNGVSFGCTDQGIFLREMVDGKERALQRSFPISFTDRAWHTFSLRVRGNTVTAWFDGHVMYRDIPTRLGHGAVGIKVWGDTVPAESILQSLTVEPLTG